MLFIGNARVVVNIICSGMLDRFPELKIVSVESGIGWIPFILEALDYEMRENAPQHDGPPVADAVGVLQAADLRDLLVRAARPRRRSIDAVGEDNIMFETDFPHPTCLYPDSLQHVARSLEGVAPGVPGRCCRTTRPGSTASNCPPDPWAATSSASTCSSTRRCSARESPLARVARRRAADAGFQLVGLDVFTLDASGLAPGEVRTLLDRNGVRCFEMLGLVVNASDDETLEGARRTAHWVGETGAEWVLTVVDSPVDDTLVDRFGPGGRSGAGRGRPARAGVPSLHGGVDDRRTRGPSATPSGPSGPVCSSTAGTCSTVPTRSPASPRSPLTPSRTSSSTTRCRWSASPSTRSWPARVWPGAGEFPLAAFAEAIRATGYSGPVSVEVLNAEWRDDGLPVADFARDASAHLPPLLVVPSHRGRHRQR